MKSIEQQQDSILDLLSGKIEGYYLAGGTALSRHYLHHRESIDLDFFTKKFDINQITVVINSLSDKLGKPVDTSMIQSKSGLAKVAVYFVRFSPDSSLKLDFVEDFFALIKPLKPVNGIDILSIEDIYLRKLYAAAGTISRTDATGRSLLIGGRAEAKDYFDLYVLSTVFLPLSDFISKYADNSLKEGLIRWFATYDRLDMKTGLLEIKANSPFDFSAAEKHFKKEVDIIIEKEIDLP